MNTSRTPVRWLQLSDLHVIPDSPAWDEFEKDYRAFLANNPEISPDFVLVSGDYRNIKTTSPFGPAITFLQAIKNALQLKDDCFFMVPGNHDMAPKRAETDRRTAEMKKLLPLDVTPWEHVDEKTAEMHRELCENEPSDYLDRLCKISRTEGENPNTVTWEILSDGFAEYSDQARKLVPWYKSEDRKPTEPQLRIWKAINSDRAVQCIIIIHLNTAIIADGSRSHYQAIDFNKTKNVFDRAAENKYPSIILAHNSFYDLHGQIQKHLRPLLIQANTCCWVCGDAHKFDNKEIMCPIDNDGVFYSVPIFVCAKSAADHGDDFSDVGFMYYEANGEEIQSTEYIWSKNLHGISTGDVVTKKFANPSNPEFNGKLRVGYLSCSPDEEAKSKYHLGHAYFIYMIDEWRKSGHVLLLSSSHSNEHNRKVNTLEKKEEDMKSLRLRWEDCFGGDDIHVIDIKDYLDEQNDFDDTEKRLHNYIGEVEEGLRRSWEWYQFLENWYVGNKPIATHAYDGILDLLKEQKKTEPESEGKAEHFQEEALAFAYLLFKNPTWYSSSWVVNFLRFWNSQLDSIVKEKFREDISDIVIVESKRNRYVWDAFAFCAKKFGYSNYPRAEYFDCVDGTDGRPMKSSNKKGVVLLAGRSVKYNETFKKQIKEKFGMENSTQQAVDELREKYASRLGLVQE